LPVPDPDLRSDPEPPPPEGPIANVEVEAPAVETEAEVEKEPEPKSPEVLSANIEFEFEALQTRLAAEAKENGVEGAEVHQKWSNALRESLAIARGLISPHEGIPALRSDEIFISYSRRNEELANLSHLAYREMGMQVWFDNQETNVSPTQEGPRGDVPIAIGMGTHWEEAIEVGMPENGFAQFNLTHDVLDKFDVIGREVRLAIKKNNKIIVAQLDQEDEENGSIKKRVEQMIEENPESEDATALRALIEAPIMSLKREYLQDSTALGRYSVDSLMKFEGVSESEESPEYRLTGPRQSVKPEGWDEADAGDVVLTDLEQVRKELDREAESVDQNDEKLVKINKHRQQSVQEAAIIVEGQTHPERIVENIGSKDIFVPPIEGELKEGADLLREEARKLGFYKARGPRVANTVAPLSPDMFVPGREEELKKCFPDLENLLDPSILAIWTEPEVGQILSRIGEKEKAKPYMEQDHFRAKLAKLAGKQALIMPPDNFRDPRGLLSYTLTKKRLLESARRTKASDNWDLMY
jgi:hypothetical protein